jgi:hypothetical protein
VPPKRVQYVVPPTPMRTAIAPCFGGTVGSSSV